MLGSQHLHQRQAQRIDIDPGVGLGRGRPQEHLWRHVHPGADVAVGDAEVAELDRAVARQQHIRRLDVVVHDALAVHGSEGVAQHCGPADDLVLGHRAGCIEPGGQAAAGAVLHHQDALVRMDEVMVEGHHAGVIEL